MAPKIDWIDEPDLVRRYLAGESAKKIARELGVASIVAYRILRDHGVQRRVSGPKRVSVPVEELVRRYRDGESENQVAKRYAISRRSVERILRLAGVTRRTQSDSERLKWAAMTGAQRSRQVAKAHAAVRGREVSLEERCKGAKSRERAQSHSSDIELRLAEMLSARGVVTVPQQAIGPYNCDLGSFPVAVEVFGGEWHWSGEHLGRTPRRFRHLMEAGWHILAVHVTTNRFPLTDATADHVAAYVQRMRGEPTIRREYRVIRSHGELVAAGGMDDEHISIVGPRTLGRDASTGRYKSVPW